MPYFFTTLIIVVLISRLLTVLLHELGHAVPAILMTKQKGTIYIGSYGDPANSLRLNFGMIEIYFRINPIRWRPGLFISSATEMSVNQQIVYLVAGPITSVIIATIASFLIFSYDLHGFWRLFAIVFSMSAIFDLMMSLIPRTTAFPLHDGTIAYNDGHTLTELIALKRVEKSYTLAADLYNGGHYVEAVVLFEKIVAKGIHEPDVYRALMGAYIHLKNYEKAAGIAEDFLLTDGMDADDLFDAAFCCSRLERREKALEFFEKSLALDTRHKLSLNDMGYSLELDKDNSYAYRNLGIYHFDRGEYKEALSQFRRAKELDGNTHMVDELIKSAEHKIEEI